MGSNGHGLNLPQGKLSAEPFFKQHCEYIHIAISPIKLPHNNESQCMSHCTIFIFCRKSLKAVNYLISFSTVRFLIFYDHKACPSEIGLTIARGCFLLFDWLLGSTHAEVLSKLFRNPRRIVFKSILARSFLFRS